MLPFDPPKNIRKTKVFKGFLMVSAGSKGNIGKKRVDDTPIMPDFIRSYGYINDLSF